MSVIWSIANPVFATDEDKPRLTVATKEQNPSSITSESILTTHLGNVNQDAVGILKEEQTGIVRNFWGDSDPQVIARLIKPFLGQALPEITLFWQRIALSEIEPPAQGDKDSEILLARLDHLLQAGSLEQAEALVELANLRSKQIFARAFDIGLLTGRTHSACTRMLANPNLAPNIKARIFCLARAGDWSAAAITLTTAAVLQQVSEGDEELMGRFLDPELFADTPPPPPPTPLTPIDFVMREALALPRVGSALPLSYLHLDLENQTGWRNRVIATEKLVRSHAIPPQRLIALYQEGESAASGGVWVRVDAVQNLLTAIAEEDEDALSPALITAYTELSKAGLLFVLSELAAEELRDMSLTPQAQAMRFHLWLLNRDYEELTFEYTPQSDRDRFLFELAQIRPVFEFARSDIELSVAAAFTGTKLKNSILWDARQGRFGEAVLKSLTVLVKSRHDDPVAVETALATLLIAGLDDEARRIAFQIVLSQSDPL